MAAEHEAIFQQMQRSKSGWKREHFRKLYVGYGFECIETGSDTKYRHIKANLWAYVSRSSKELPTGYAVTAVKRIRSLIEWEREQEQSNDQNP